MDDRFPGVGWVCDNCFAVLHEQDGFDDYEDYWTCAECGYENRISDGDIYESTEDYLASDDRKRTFGDDGLPLSYSYGSNSNSDDDDDDDDEDDEDDYEIVNNYASGNSTGRGCGCLGCFNSFLSIIKWIIIIVIVIMLLPFVLPIIRDLFP